MPYLGHRDSVFVDMGISAHVDSADSASPLESQAARVVTRLAHDEADRAFLLEALGLTPTVDDLAVAG